jgi:nitroimidazol reductase NimA-like FMN-containing flavoprotein (pyridoxamine 5'-phosphate oxidase superfamily)
MTATAPAAHIDTRFSEPEARETPWPLVEEALHRAELYWITTVRQDGRPHVTPLVGVWHEGAFVFCTGFGEQKAHNLAGNAHVAVTTGRNTWAEGLDVVVEGTAERALGRERLQALADAFRAKYGSDWDFDSDDAVFEPGDDPGAVFVVRPDKVLCFAKAPHAQTCYRFGNGQSARTET